MTTTADSLRVDGAAGAPATKAGVRSASASRLVTAAALWFVAVFPLMTFPEMAWPGARMLVVLASALSAGLAVLLLREWRPLDLLVASLFLLAGQAWLRVADEKEAFTHLSGIAVGLLAMALTAAWTRTPARLRLVLGLFLGAGLAALALGLAGTTTAPYKLIALHPDSLPQLKLGLPGLPANGWVNPNALGGMALMIVPLAAALWHLPAGPGRGGRLLRLLAAATTVVGLAVIIVGQARTVWLAAWLTTVIAVWWVARDVRRRLVWTALLCAVPVVFLAAMRGSSVQPGRIFSDGLFAFAFRADVVWSQGLEQLQSSPWFGIGLNHFRHAYRAPEWLREGTRESAHAHNIWLQTALDLGLVGCAVYVALLGYVLWLALRVGRNRDGVARQVAVGAALAVVGVHLFGIADAVSLGARVGLFQWVAAGFVLAASRQAPPADPAVPLA